MKINIFRHNINLNKIFKNKFICKTVFNLNKINKNNIFDITAFLLSICFAILGSIISLNRFWQYDIWYYDFGIFDQAIWRAAQFKAPIIDHFRVSGKWIWADHFNPSIFLFSIIYLFTDKSQALLIAHNIVIGLSGFVLYLIGRKFLGRLASIIVLTAYFLYYGLQNAAYHGFQDVTVMTLFLSLTYYFIVNKKAFFYWIFFIITLGFKETLAFLGIGISIFIFLYNPKWKKIAVLSFFYSVFYGLITTKLIIPYFSSGHYYYLEEYSINTTFIRLWQKIIDKQVLINLFWNMASFFFLPLLQLKLLPIIFLDIVVRSLSDRYILGLHYNAEIAPTLFMSTVFALNNIKKTFNYQTMCLSVMCLFITSVVLFRFILHGPFLLAFNPVFYKHKYNFEYLEEPISLIPKNAKVAAQHNLTSRFFHQEVFILRPGWESFDPDFILFDLREGQNPNNFLGLDFEKKDQFFETILKNPNYKVIYQKNN
ncbi:MAG: DUF2079 domain-containing protein, partial [Candidatus Omnitrophica bacterium]|nr:DUF2079 domain-containing protein [Candidatus Omnitrophota bacterium]